MRFIALFLFFFALFLMTVAEEGTTTISAIPTTTATTSIPATTKPYRWVWDSELGKWIPLGPPLNDPNDYDEPGRKYRSLSAYAYFADPFHLLPYCGDC